METSAANETSHPECQASAPSDTVVSEARQIAADQTIILSSNLPDGLPVLPEELELMHRYFDDLIQAAIAGAS
jgi:hypothetical protein